MASARVKIERIRKNFDLPKRLVRDCELIMKTYPTRYRSLTHLVETALENWTMGILEEIDKQKK